MSRLKTDKLTSDSAMGARQVRDRCKFDAEGKGYLENAMAEMNFSTRAHDRFCKLLELWLT